MQPTGNNQHGLPAAPGRPISPFAPAAPQTKGPPSSAGSGAGSQGSAAPQATTPLYPGSYGASQTHVPGAVPPVRFSGQSSPRPAFYPSKDPTSYAQSSKPQFPSSVQVGTPFHGTSFGSQQVPHPPVSQTSFPRPPGSQIPLARPFPGFPGSQSPPIPMGIPQHGSSSAPLGGNAHSMPLGGSMPPPPLGGSRTPTPVHGHSVPTSQSFLANPTPNVLPVYPSPFPSHQGGYVPGPPTTPPMGVNSREYMPQHIAGPPLGASLQGLVEEFQSLSVGSTPGSVDPGIDVKSLPRPLDSDEEPRSISEAYPLNCHSRYLRLTTHAIPNSQSLFARWHLPLGAVVHPLAEAPDGEEVPIVNFGPAGVVRCRRCRTYINPYATFTDMGRKWRCNLCSLLNDVPGEYFCSLDTNGRRLDINQRPELLKGSVEFVAPTEYMVRPPMPPLYFFLIDVSASAVQCGVLEIIAETIKSCLDGLPGFPRTQIGFITFDSTLHYYNLKSSLTQPQMIVVPDLDDIFVPLPDDLLVNLSDSRSVVDAFLDSLPSMFQGNLNLESALGPALKAAFMVMSQLGGKLLIFQSTLPSLGIGSLKLRGDDLRIYGSDKEHTLRIPEDPFYKQMAAEFTKYQIGVNVYAFNDKYCDLASLGSLAKYTGGQVYYYPSFRADIHHEKLRYELARDLARETAWEAVMRVRCGKGVRFTTYHGHFMLRSTDLLALPAVDCDKAFVMQLAMEETLLTSQTVYFQVALLYTSSSGERRIRVHTAAAHVVTDLGEMYRQADMGAIVCLMSRLAIEKSLSHKLEDARQFVQLRIVKSLKEYRNLYAVQHRLGGRLIYPESLKLLPLYGLALCKSLALRGGYADALLDERCATGYSMMIFSVKRMMKLLYPCLIRIDEIIMKAAPLDADESGDMLKPLPLTMAVLDPKGLYVLDDGSRFVIWFGRMLYPDLISDIFGVDYSGFADLSKVVLNERESEASKKLMKIIRKLRKKDQSCYQLCDIVRQGEQPRESMLFLSNLIEDQTAGTSGYVDWIVQLYRQTQQNP